MDGAPPEPENHEMTTTLKTYSTASTAKRAAGAIANKLSAETRVIAFGGREQDGNIVGFVSVDQPLSSIPAADLTLLEGFAIVAAEAPAPEAPTAEAPAPVKTGPGRPKADIPQVKKSTAEKPVQIVWRLCEEMKGASRSEVVKACVAAGVATGTARTQYQAWKKAKEADPKPKK
jgi:hypothetical protein